MSNKHFTTSRVRYLRDEEKRIIREQRQAAARHKRELLALQRKFAQRSGKVVV